MTDIELPPDPRIVKPRARTYKRLPVVALDQGVWLDEDGQTGEQNELVTFLRKQPATLFVSLGSADWVANVSQYFAMVDPERWQWRVTTQEKSIMVPGRHVIAARVTTVVHYFGFKGVGRGKTRIPSTYHKIIDPVVMYGRDLDTIWPGDRPAIYRLLGWGIAIRNFCDENQIEVRPTIGSMSAQFWTDKRFYPRARRKVPGAINDRARQELPGNHYQLFVHPTPRREYTALYLDQQRAHHYHARTTPLPDANSLYAYGYFQDLRDVAFTETQDNFQGLYCLDVEVPSTQSCLPLQTGTRFVFSNELQMLRDVGCRILGVRAAWGSFQRDKGVARYAAFAETQLDRYKDAPWIKPLLLAAYGTLATRASYGETIFKLAKRGEQVSIHTGHNRLHGTLTRAPQKLEPKIANVIHRGMIEAATRADSIGLAHWLTSRGHYVLSIYADAVIVQQDDDKPLPDLPDPWRLKQTLNHLQFLTKQAFISGEMTKLPGVSSELKAYARNSTGKAPRRWFDLGGTILQTHRRI